MNKKLLVLAVAGVMAMPLAVNAGGKSKVYGAVHVSVNQVDGGELGLDGGGSKANKLGMKGSMDSNIADFKAIYQLEAGVVVGQKNSLFERDTWAGLSSKSMGTVRAGTMATHYKQMGKATDALFTTNAEGRGGLLATQSKLHGGYGASGGRATQMLRYDSPSISGAKVIAQYQMVAGGDNNMGLGLEYKAGNYLAFFDYMDLKSKGESTAMKFGGKAKFGAASVALQYELDDDGNIETVANGGNQLHVQGTYSMGSTTFVASVGRNDENLGYAVAVSQKVAKKASVYAGYTANGADGDGNSAMTAGMKVAFGK